MDINWRGMAALAVTVLALTLVACDDDGDDGRAPTATSTAPGNPTPAATRSSGGGDGGAADAYRAAVLDFIDATFRAEYRATAAPEDELENASLVIYKQGADKFRTDITADQEGERVELIVIDVRDDPNGSGFCLAEAGELGAAFGVDAGDGICFASDPTSGEGFGFLTDGLDDIENEDVEVRGRSERQIAGRDADCFAVTDDSGQANEVCFGDDGELLYVAGDDGSVIEATEVDGDVADGDFDLPYEVRDLSAPPPAPPGAGQ